MSTTQGMTILVMLAVLLAMLALRWVLRRRVERQQAKFQAFLRKGNFYHYDHRHDEVTYNHDGIHGLKDEWWR